jgi:hypothetical protein
MELIVEALHFLKCELKGTFGELAFDFNLWEIQDRLDVERESLPKKP